MVKPAGYELGLQVDRLSHSLYYANAPRSSEEVLALADGAGSKIDCFCLDSLAIDDVDYSASATLRSTYNVLQDMRIRFVLVGIGQECRGRAGIRRHH